MGLGPEIVREDTPTVTEELQAYAQRISASDVSVTKGLIGTGMRLVQAKYTEAILAAIPDEAEKRKVRQLLDAAFINEKAFNAGLGGQQWEWEDEKVKIGKSAFTGLIAEGANIDERLPRKTFGYALSRFTEGSTASVVGNKWRTFEGLMERCDIKLPEEQREVLVVFMLSQVAKKRALDRMRSLVGKVSGNLMYYQPNVQNIISDFSKLTGDINYAQGYLVVANEVMNTLLEKHEMEFEDLEGLLDVFYFKRVTEDSGPLPPEFADELLGPLLIACVENNVENVSEGSEFIRTNFQDRIPKWKCVEGGRSVHDGLKGIAEYVVLGHMDIEDVPEIYRDSVLKWILEDKESVLERAHKEWRFNQICGGVEVLLEVLKKVSRKQGYDVNENEVISKRNPISVKVENMLGVFDDYENKPDHVICGHNLYGPKQRAFVVDVIGRPKGVDVRKMFVELVYRVYSATKAGDFRCQVKLGELGRYVLEAAEEIGVGKEEIRDFLGVVFYDVLDKQTSIHAPGAILYDERKHAVRHFIKMLSPFIDNKQ